MSSTKITLEFSDGATRNCAINDEFERRILAWLAFEANIKETSDNLTAQFGVGGYENG